MTQKRTNENDRLVSGNPAPAVRRKTARVRSKHSATPAETSVIAASADLEASPDPASLAPVELAAVAVASQEPSRDEIARLAYSYWEARGCQGGSAEEDWLRAELEIRGTASVAI
jgi:hypothetical protein